MEKVFNNQATLAKRMNNKVRRPILVLPKVSLGENGEFVLGSGYAEISSYDQFCEYVDTQSVVIEYLKENYPSVIAKIYKNALSELTDPENATIAGKLLTGRNVKDVDSFDAGLAPNGESTVYGIIRTAIAKKSGLEGKSVELPVVKRPKRRVMSMFIKNKNGYFVPEIDANGLVVAPSRDRTHFNIKFIGVKESDITKEQLLEYFKAPYGEKADESGVDFERLVELCKEAYKSMDDSNVVNNVQEIANFCASNLPMSFANIKDDRKIEAVPTEEPVVEEPVEETHAEESVETPVEETPDERDLVSRALVPKGGALIVIEPKALEPVYEYSIETSKIKSFSNVLKVKVVKKPLVTHESHGYESEK